MSKYTYNQVAQGLSSVSNASFLKAAVDMAPQYAAIASRVSNGIFTESNVEALRSLPTGNDNLTEIYGLFMLIAAQRFDKADFRNVFENMGILDRQRMPLGEYVAHFKVARLESVNPGFDGLSDGDSPDQFEFRPFEVEEIFYGGKNKDYQNFFSFKQYDLKRGLMKENGIGEILSLVYQAVDIDRVTKEESEYKEVINRAIHSEQFPLQGTQQFVLDAPKATVANFTANTFTVDELNSLCEALGDIDEELRTASYTTAFNADKIPGNLNPDDYVLVMRKGYKNKVSQMIANIYHQQYYDRIPFKTYLLSDFGGIEYYADAAFTTELQVVYDRHGAPVGLVNASYTNVSPAEQQSNGTYTVKYGANQGSTATVTSFNEAYKKDPNEEIMAILVEKGFLFELIQNPFLVQNAPNYRGQYVTTWFSQEANYIGWNCRKGFITISRQQHTED